MRSNFTSLCTAVFVVIERESCCVSVVEFNIDQIKKRRLTNEKKSILDRYLKPFWSGKPEMELFRTRRNCNRNVSVSCSCHKRNNRHIQTEDIRQFNISQCSVSVLN
ncbi:hypothetical protein ABEB36_008814 [Hypothenemus hampei]|uniref:Secreted protein n=1 Tax=Hypothenemus hampei TaxID=57062 RepID=A0ABD1ENR0_HYPHA